MKTTEDCKAFIKSLSSEICGDNDVWKRTKKYKNNEHVLRDFENQYGRVLTIMEKDNSLFLYSLSAYVDGVSSQNQSLPGKKHFTRKPNEKDVFNFISECVKNDISIVDGDKATYTDAIQPVSWTVWESWVEKPSKNDDSGTLSDYFSGYYGQGVLYYEDSQGNKEQLDEENIVKVFWVGMPDYDTRYRIFVYQTKDNSLMLGENEPD